MYSATPAQIAATARPLTILLVDDHPALRSGLRSLLSSREDFQVQGEAASGEAAYSWYRTHHPDIVVMDLGMGGYGGLEALRHIIQIDPQARILVYTVHTSDAMLNRALALGALGYVSKGSEIDVLIQGIREVACHRGFVSPDMVSALVRAQAGQDRRSLLEKMSDREFQILLLIAQGRKVAECAQTLNLSDKTVSNHLTRIKAKLGVANTAELTRLAIRKGLVEP